MGLDTVELVMEIENYFKIRIPDREAETLATIENIVAVVAAHRAIYSTDTSLRDNLLRKINSFFQFSPSIKNDDLISKQLSLADADKWQNLEAHLSLPLPKPTIRTHIYNKLHNKIRSLLHSREESKYNWDTISLSGFCDAICIKNFDKLIHPDKIKTKYEIYIAVGGLVVEKSGADYFDIGLPISITDDLGLD